VEYSVKISHVCALGLLMFSAAAFAQATDAAKDASKDVAANKVDPMSVQGSGGMDWKTVSGNDKGYLMMKDAPANSWLAMNFKKCDADSNGKITELEYGKCQNPQR